MLFGKPYRASKVKLSGQAATATLVIFDTAICRNGEGQRSCGSSAAAGTDVWQEGWRDDAELLPSAWHGRAGCVPPAPLPPSTAAGSAGVMLGKAPSPFPARSGSDPGPFPRDGPRAKSLIQAGGMWGVLACAWGLG